MALTSPLIGCDPEFFLFDTKQDRCVSAHNLIPGNKKNPHKVECGAIQVDGTAVEFNIDPARSAEEFDHNIQTVLDILRKEIPSRYDFRFCPLVIYQRRYFDSLPPETKELGCDPDYSAILAEQNPVVRADTIKTQRTGSGHIHIGWTDNASTEPLLENPHFIDCCIFTQLFSKVFSQLESRWALDNNEIARRYYYGHRASFRCKPYGVECRELSNSWVPLPKIRKSIFKTTTYIFEEGLKKTKTDRMISEAAKFF